jgi:hypothetical protein
MDVLALEKVTIAPGTGWLVMASITVITKKNSQVEHMFLGLQSTQLCCDNGVAPQYLAGSL